MTDIVKSHFKEFDLDIRKKGNNPRFLDQKCTPDVLSFIADCILQNNNKEFTTKDILESNYFRKTLTIIFGKPSPNDSPNEYDKFVSQPSELLSYAGILTKCKNGNKNKYTISNHELLEYIALRDRNAYYFLCEYLIKFSIDSGINNVLKDFFQKQDEDTFIIMKEKFNNLIISNSSIGNRGSETKNNTEIRRIFPKYLNILSAQDGLKGSIKGRISKYILTYSDLMYNRNNFRDLDKPKNLSRDKFKQENATDTSTYEYNDYLIGKAKAWVKRHHQYSEVNDNLYGQTSHIHHIFPQSEFITIAHYVENLIALTAGQHQDKAHPKGNTKIVDRAYQLVCLLAKSNTIKKSESSGLSVYSRLRFIEVLHTGFSVDESKISFKDNFETLDSKIKTHYKENL